MNAQIWPWAASPRSSVWPWLRNQSTSQSSGKRGDYLLACGLPVIANEGVGDVADIIRTHKVGVLVEGTSDEQLHSAWNQLDQLLQDPTLSSRCRRTVESVFSLDAGIKAYRKLYEETFAQVKPGELKTS